MATVLGSSYRRGKADVVGSYKLVGAEAGTSTALQEGLVVGLSSDSEHVALGGTPIGVTGKGNKLSVAVCEGGKRVWAQADAGVTTVTLGAQCFVTSTGKITTSAGEGNANTAINATFASTEVRNDGVSTNIKGSAVYNLKCVCIDFLGGM